MRGNILLVGAALAALLFMKRGSSPAASNVSTVSLPSEFKGITPSDAIFKVPELANYAPTSTSEPIPSVVNQELARGAMTTWNIPASQFDQAYSQTYANLQAVQTNIANYKAQIYELQTTGHIDGKSRFTDWDALLPRLQTGLARSLSFEQLYKTQLGVK